MKVTIESLRSKDLQELSDITKEKVNDCMQCAKCSAGCPVLNAMDLMPHEVIRYLQLGMFEEALASKTIWICASCFTCASRCPRDVDVAKVMEGLRVMALRQRGGNRFRPEELPAALAKDVPQQALVSGFRKYSK